jgi:hypothetical protein
MNFVEISRQGLFDESQDGLGLSIVILVDLGLIVPSIGNGMQDVEDGLLPLFSFFYNYFYPFLFRKIFITEPFSDVTFSPAV